MDNVDIIIRTGFEKIFHFISFQPQTEKKGKLLFDAGHVCDVEEFRKNGASYLIKSQVIRQASVSKTRYQTKLYIDENRIVIRNSCTCAYNQSNKCKHVAALIYYINYEESFTKTDRLQEWGKPTTHQMMKEKYSKGKFFHEMFPPPSKPKVKPFEIDLSKLKQPSALRTVLMESAKDKTECSVNILIAWILAEVDLILKKEDCAACLEFFQIVNEENTVYRASVRVLPKELELFYEENIVLNSGQISNLCCDTIDQSTNDLWYSARHLRISASTNVFCIKKRVTKTVDSLVSDILNPRSIDNPSIKYGRKYEDIARKEYEKLYDCKVLQVGVLVSESQPWLCCSLDGVVVEDSCITKLVEIKCPSTCENKKVVDIIERKLNVNYLEFRHNQVELKLSASYYTQCQTQMYITGLSVCDLFIYSLVKNGSYCVQVYRNEKFIEEMILKSESFYFDHYLQALYKENSVKLSKRNVNQVINNEQTRCFTGTDIKNKVRC